MYSTVDLITGAEFH